MLSFTGISAQPLTSFAVFGNQLIHEGCRKNIPQWMKLPHFGGLLRRDRSRAPSKHDSHYR